MSSPNGSQREQAQPPKTTKLLGIRCWILVIITGYGELPPVWVPCQMPVTGPLRTVS